jgi:hypothetical protein
MPVVAVLPATAAVEEITAVAAVIASVVVIVGSAASCWAFEGALEAVREGTGDAEGEDEDEEGLEPEPTAATPDIGRGGALGGATTVGEGGNLQQLPATALASCSSFPWFLQAAGRNTPRLTTFFTAVIKSSSKMGRRLSIFVSLPPPSPFTPGPPTAVSANRSYIWWGSSAAEFGLDVLDSIGARVSPLLVLIAPAPVLATPAVVGSSDALLL